MWQPSSCTTQLVATDFIYTRAWDRPERAEVSGGETCVPALKIAFVSAPQLDHRTIDGSAPRVVAFDPEDEK